MTPAWKVVAELFFSSLKNRSEANDRKRELPVERVVVFLAL
jgi:hypothetical protein